MNQPVFQDYRCTGCGKLLLKGCVFQGIVELKCKRCKKVTSWGVTETTPYAVIDTNTDEQVVRVSGETETVFGCGKEYVLGKRLADILEHVTRSVPHKNHYQKGSEKREGYDIPDNHLVLHDGERRSVRTYVTPRREHGIVAGKRIFLAPGSSDTP